MARVGVVGAGLSGLSFTHRLLQFLRMRAICTEVSVFEWGRGPGGRLARKRVTLDLDGASKTIFFDHGCPDFSLRDPAVIALLQGAGDEEQLPLETCVEEVPAGPPGTSAADPLSTRLFVGTPESNNALVKAFARAVDSENVHLLYGRHVKECRRKASGEWVVHVWDRILGKSEEYEFDLLILTDKLAFLGENPYNVLPEVPGAAQAYLQKRLALRAPESRVVGLVAFWLPEEHASRLRQLGPFLAGTGDLLGRLIQDSAKPGRAPVSGGDENARRELSLWVLQSTAEAARDLLEFQGGEGRLRADVDEGELLGRMVELGIQRVASSGDLSPGLLRGHVAHTSLFVWDHAVAGDVASDGAKGDGALSFFDEAMALGMAGDYWGRGHVPLEGRLAPASDVEAAILSAHELAEAVDARFIGRELQSNSRSKV